jgi:hypothetical protein
MSYEVCVVEFAPVLPQEKRNMGKWEQMKEKVRQVNKVLFDRNHTQIFQKHEHDLPPTSDDVSTAREDTGEEQYTATDKKTDEPVVLSTHVLNGVVLPKGHPHGYSRWKFVGYHIIKGTICHGLEALYNHYDDHFSPLVVPPSVYMKPELASYYQRLAMTPIYREMYWRLQLAFDWNVVSLWSYESYHSFFAVLYVASGLDEPHEWSTTLFGPFSSAWSVRRYWGKHWHNYVYHSLTGHIKCMTRGWLGMMRGAMSTRLIENTLVLLASGLMHSLVRWYQVAPSGEYWIICYWYVAQMLPIIFEGSVATLWSKLRKWLGFGADTRWLNALEYAIGYFWVIAWFVYSIGKYRQTRAAWAEAKRIEQFKAELAAAWASNETTAVW